MKIITYAEATLPDPVPGLSGEGEGKVVEAIKQYYCLALWGSRSGASTEATLSDPVPGLSGEGEGRVVEVGVLPEPLTLDDLMMGVAVVFFTDARRNRDGHNGVLHRVGALRYASPPLWTHVLRTVLASVA